MGGIFYGNIFNFQITCAYYELGIRDKISSPDNNDFSFSIFAHVNQKLKKEEMAM